MKTFGFIFSIVCASVSFYFVIKGETLEAILFMTYAIYNKLDTKDQVMKETLIFLYELLYFVLISLPLALTIYLTALIIGKFKNI